MSAAETVRFAMDDGTVLSTRCDAPEVPRAVVLLIPGFALTSDDYVGFGGALSRLMAAAVYGVDLRGQGGSGGRPGDIDDVGRLSEDLATLSAALRARHPGLPLWWIAHSSGGSLALRSLDADPAIAPSGLVLIAPVLCGHLQFDRRRTALHRLRQRLLWGRVLPEAERAGDERDDFRFSLGRALLARLVPRLGGLTVLTVRRPGLPRPLAFSARFFRGYSCADPAEALARIVCPVWVMIGEEDEYSLPDAVVALAKWNCAPDRLRAVERVKGQGHFGIFAAATVLVASWLKGAAPVDDRAA